MLCYLTKCHNYSFGDINSLGSIAYQGYACPTFGQIKNTLNIGSNETITNILEHLEKLKLITILKSDVVSTYVNAEGITKFKRVSNKYIILSKIPNNQYFISIKKSKDKLKNTNIINEIKNSDDIEKLKNMPYQEYLKSEHWKETRKKALQRAYYKCGLCFSKEKLNVHHKIYEHKGYEHPEDLIVLCKHCHSKFHDILD